jgi:anti-sigma B factor antagonist
MASTAASPACDAVACCPVVTVHVQGELDLATAPRIRECLYDALTLRPTHLVVDLAECPFFDAIGINLLLDVHRHAWRQQARLRLRGCSERHMRLLALMGLHDVFEIEESG